MRIEGQNHYSYNNQYNRNHANNYTRTPQSVPRMQSNQLQTNQVQTSQAQSRRYQSATSQTDMRLYEQMTSLIDTRQGRTSSATPASYSNADSHGLTNRKTNGILSGNYSMRDTSRLMSARNQLADTNIARSSLVNNSNSVIGRYQQFMRDSSRQNAKSTLQKFI